MTHIQKKMSNWQINERYCNAETSISLGLILNPELLTEVLDKGPQADQEEAVEFRLFWGKKSQLRRFQDG